MCDFYINSFFFQAEDGIRDGHVTGVQTCALPICIWDTGTIEIEKWREGSEVIAICRGQDDGGLGGQPRRFAFVHTGRMGGGRRTTAAKEAEQKNWLLQLMKDQPGGEGTSAGGSRKSAAGTGRDRATEQMSEPLAPMLATLGSRSDIREEERWAYEMKWDGVRSEERRGGKEGRG